jgi:hypothetical protein
MTLLPGTGPLVAAIDRSDKHHARCAALLESAPAPLLIPTTVIVEVCWLLEERPDIESAFLASVAAGEFEHITLTATDLARTAELVRVYADLPLGAADASVIAIAERLKLTDVATLDRRHFTTVRPRHTTALIFCPSHSGHEPTEGRHTLLTALRHAGAVRSVLI